eukprot:g1970.t1
MGAVASASVDDPNHRGHHSDSPSPSNRSSNEVNRRGSSSSRSSRRQQRHSSRSGSQRRAVGGNNFLLRRRSSSSSSRRSQDSPRGEDLQHDEDIERIRQVIMLSELENHDRNASSCTRSPKDTDNYNRGSSQHYSDRRSSSSSSTTSLEERIGTYKKAINKIVPNPLLRLYLFDRLDEIEKMNSSSSQYAPPSSSSRRSRRHRATHLLQNSPEAFIYMNLHEMGFIRTPSTRQRYMMSGLSTFARVRRVSAASSPYSTITQNSNRYSVTNNNSITGSNSSSNTITMTSSGKKIPTDLLSPSNLRSYIKSGLVVQEIPYPVDLDLYNISSLPTGSSSLSSLSSLSNSNNPSSDGTTTDPKYTKTGLIKPPKYAKALLLPKEKSPAFVSTTVINERRESHHEKDTDTASMKEHGNSANRPASPPSSLFRRLSGLTTTSPSSVIEESSSNAAVEKLKTKSNLKTKSKSKIDPKGNQTTNDHEDSSPSKTSSHEVEMKLCEKTYDPSALFMHHCGGRYKPLELYQISSNLASCHGPKYLLVKVRYKRKGSHSFNSNSYWLKISDLLSALAQRKATRELSILTQQRKAQELINDDLLDVNGDKILLDEGKIDDETENVSGDDVPGSDMSNKKNTVEKKDKEKSKVKKKSVNTSSCSIDNTSSSNNGSVNPNHHHLSASPVQLPNFSEDVLLYLGSQKDDAVQVASEDIPSHSVYVKCINSNLFLCTEGKAHSVVGIHGIGNGHSEINVGSEIKFGCVSVVISQIVMEPEHEYANQLIDESKDENVEEDEEKSYLAESMPIDSDGNSNCPGCSSNDTNKNDKTNSKATVEESIWGKDGTPLCYICWEGDTEKTKEAEQKKLIEDSEMENNGDKKRKEQGREEKSDEEEGANEYEVADERTHEEDYDQKNNQEEKEEEEKVEEESSEQRQPRSSNNSRRRSRGNSTLSFLNRLRNRVPSISIPLDVSRRGSIALSDNPTSPLFNGTTTMTTRRNIATSFESNGSYRMPSRHGTSSSPAENDDNDSVNDNLNLSSTPNRNDFDDNEEEGKDSAVCKGRLIRSPCDCRGSTGYVHEGCIYQWMNRSGSRKCPVCKTAFPPSFGLKTPYLKLKVVRHQRGITWRGPKTFCLSFADKPYQTIGKNPRVVDLAFEDTSVSSLHAAIHYKNGKFCVMDLQSTCGTFIRLKEKGATLPIFQNTECYVKHGRVLVSVQTKNKKPMWS